MNKMKRLSLVAMIGVVTSAITPCASSESWPARPITLIVPFSTGGSTDTTARLLAEQLGKSLGQQVVVENRPGAASNIGGASVARAKPDGYTLLLATSTMITNVSLYKDMGFDVRKDLAPVSQIALIPNVLVVNNDVPAKTLSEFIAHVASGAAPVNYGSSGNGASQHLSGALFNHLVKGKMTHVPYKGGAPANTDLLAGHIQAVFAPMVEVLPFIADNKLRALAVTTPERSPRLPDLPTVSEFLPGYEVVLWNGIFAPAGTPLGVLDRLSQAVRSAVQDPKFKSVLAAQGSIPVGNTPAEFAAIVEREIGKWGNLVTLSGAKTD